MILAAAIVVGQFAMAHGDHPVKLASCKAAECTKAEIEMAVPLTVEAMIEKQFIGSEWRSAKTEKVELKEFKKGAEWVATLFDSKQKDATKQRLYIFMSKKGYPNGANFTGK